MEVRSRLVPGLDLDLELELELVIDAPQRFAPSQPTLTVPRSPSQSTAPMA
jgi:hypothetical protein